MTIDRSSLARAIEKPHDLGSIAMQWNQTRLEWMMAVLIATTAGYLDGYGLLFLKTYVSFMSGNTTSTGLKFGQLDFLAALPSAVAILSFVIGGFFGSLFSQSKLRHAHRIMFGLIAAGIAAVVVLEWNGLHDSNSQIALMCLAMGMTNPALSKIGAESVSVTFVTGTLTRMGGHLASAARRRILKDPQGPRDSHLRRALIEASVWTGFFSGAVLSGIAGSHSRTWGLLPPCAIMLVLGLFREGATQPSAAIQDSAAWRPL
jgi:uncharacterized membrane protein YoaK (UPF0700 family)